MLYSQFPPGTIFDTLSGQALVRIDDPKQSSPVQFDSYEESVMWNMECNRQIEKGENVTDAIDSADVYLNAWKSRSKTLMEARAARNKTYEENS